MEKPDRRSVRYGNLTILYLPHLDGGGREFGQDIVRFVGQKIGPVDHAMEWCSGPGFIGFSLLSRGLCRRLTLADINPEATAIAQESVELNHLARNVSVVTSDCFESVPMHKLDLVVANPPHTPGGYLFEDWGPEILYVDESWASHRKFYGAAGKFLSADGSIVMQEYGEFSSVEDFEPMILASGLEIVDTFDSVDGCYFIWSKVRRPGS